MWAGERKSPATQTFRALFPRSPSCWRTCSPPSSIWTSCGWWRRCGWSSVCSSGSLRRMWRRWVLSVGFLILSTVKKKMDEVGLGHGQEWLFRFDLVQGVADSVENTKLEKSVEPMIFHGWFVEEWSWGYFEKKYERLVGRGDGIFFYHRPGDLFKSPWIIFCLQMFEWISHNRDLFLVNYTEIGTCHQMAVELESEHCQFATSAEVCKKCPLVFLPSQWGMILLKVFFFLVWGVWGSRQEI